MTSDKVLLNQAQKAKQKSFSPYSNYPVGAAVDTDVGVFQGANIEISGRVTSVHAEMMAMYTAVMNGAQEFYTLAVSPNEPTGVAICGLCQHTVAQFCEDIRIIEDVENGENEVYSLKELIGPAYSPSTRHAEHVNNSTTSSQSVTVDVTEMIALRDRLQEVLKAREDYPGRNPTVRYCIKCDEYIFSMVDEQTGELNELECCEQHHQYILENAHDNASIRSWVKALTYFLEDEEFG